MFPAPGSSAGGQSMEASLDEAGLPRKTVLACVQAVLQEGGLSSSAEQQPHSAPSVSSSPSRVEHAMVTEGRPRDAITAQNSAREHVKREASTEETQLGATSPATLQLTEETACSNMDAECSKDESLPQNGPEPALTLHPDARDLICACANTFVRSIAVEANKAKARDQKRTIFSKHILAALEQMGLEAYVPVLQPLLERVEDEQVERQRRKTGRARFEHTGLSIEELKRQQAELLAAAREQALWP
jgi:hypothetical protein